MNNDKDLARAEKIQAARRLAARARWGAARGASAVIRVRRAAADALATMPADARIEFATRAILDAARR